MFLQNQIALVSGASSGIGKAIALELWRRGAKVALASRRLPELEAIVREWSSFPRKREASPSDSRLLAVKLDVQDDESCRQAIDAVAERWGGLSLLVNNAGFGVYGPAEVIPLKEAKELFETNYFGACRLTLAAFPQLKRAGGASVVMVSSIAGAMGVPWMGHYGASKAAMNNLTETLRMELKPYGIHVFAVLPGITRTEFGANARFFGGARNPASGLGGQSAEFVAQVTCNAIERDCRDVISGWSNRFLVFIRRALAPVAETLMSRFYGPWGGSW